MSTKAEPKHRGTLVCVVLKAKNLPNKRSIGKQDPYCVLQIGTEQHKTKPDKRGGQHPQWDEQLHFEIYDDMEDQLRKAEDDGQTTGPLSQTTKRKTKVGKSLRVSCYADDNKEPEFIGEGVVDLTDTLRSGEFDEWVTIKAKDRYAGEVYLELTFYSSAAPPKPKKVLKPNVPANTTYGGAGTFSEDFDESEFAPRPPVKSQSHAPIPSAFVQQSNSASHSSRLHNTSGMTASHTFSHLAGRAGRSSVSDEVPSSLRPSASIAHLDSYTPPYAPPLIQRERSPAPTQPPPSNEQPSALSTSASAHFYGHRLQDAAPANVVAQRMEDDARRYSHQMSGSSTFHHLPQAGSSSTIRPLPQHQGSIDDLVRPLSSMSMQTLPVVSEASRIASPAVASQYAAPGQEHQQWYLPAQVDQYGRPVPGYPASANSYSQIPVSATPPVHPHSAPPAPQQSELSHSQSYASAWTQPQTMPPPPQHHSTIAATQSLHQGLSHASTTDQHRPVSPNPNAAAPLPPPPRTHTPGGYQTVSQPAYPSADGHASVTYAAYPYPSQPQYQAAAPASPHPYSGPASTSTSPPKPHAGRPLPSVNQAPSAHAVSPANGIVALPVQYESHTAQVQPQGQPQLEQWKGQHQPSPSPYPPPGRSQSPLPPQNQGYAGQVYAPYPPPSSPRPPTEGATANAGSYAVAGAYQPPHPQHLGGGVQPYGGPPAPVYGAPAQQYYPPGTPSNGAESMPSALYERTYAPNPMTTHPNPSDPPPQQYYYAAQPPQAQPQQQGHGPYIGAVAGPAPPTYPHPPASYYKPTPYAGHQAPSPY